MRYVFHLFTNSRQSPLRIFLASGDPLQVFLRMGVALQKENLRSWMDRHLIRSAIAVGSPGQGDPLKRSLQVIMYDEISEVD